MAKAPCFNCPNRKVTESYNCHTDCIEYLRFRDKCRETHRTLIEENEFEYLAEFAKRNKRAKSRGAKRWN